MFTLRPATSADAPALTAIYDYYVQNTAVSFEYETPSVAEFSARLEQVRAHQLPYLVAENQGQLLGYAYACPFSERKAYLPSVELTIYLAPQHKRQGLGRALYQALEQELKAQGYENLYACIATPVVTPSPPSRIMRASCRTRLAISRSLLSSAGIACAFTIIWAFAWSACLANVALSSGATLTWSLWKS